MVATVQAIQPTKSGNDLYRTCIPEPTVVETESDVQVTMCKARAVPVELAKRMQKALDGGKKVTLNFELE